MFSIDYIKEWSESYKTDLTTNIMPFWLKYGLDKVNGGIYTCYGTNGIPVTPPNIVNYIDTTVIAKDIEESKAMKPDAIIACMPVSYTHLDVYKRQHENICHLQRKACNVLVDK